METNNEIDDIEEKYIYKNALKHIMELDVEMHDSAMGIGYMTGAEGAMRHVKKYE